MEDEIRLFGIILANAQNVASLNGDTMQKPLKRVLTVTALIRECMDMSGKSKFI